MKISEASTDELLRVLAKIHAELENRANLLRELTVPIEKRRRATKAKPGTKEEAEDYAIEIGLPKSDGAAFWDAKEGNGWKNGANKIKDWKATMRTWKANGFHPSQKGQKGSTPVFKGVDSDGDRRSLFK